MDPVELEKRVEMIAEAGGFRLVSAYWTPLKGAPTGRQSRADSSSASSPTPKIITSPSANAANYPAPSAICWTVIRTNFQITGWKFRLRG